MTWHNTHHTTLSLYIYRTSQIQTETQLLLLFVSWYSLSFHSFLPLCLFYFLFIMCLIFFFVTNQIIWIIFFCVFFQSLMIINWTLWCRGIDFRWIMVFQGKGWVENHSLNWKMFCFYKVMTWNWSVWPCQQTNAFCFLLERN